MKSGGFGFAVSAAELRIRYERDIGMVAIFSIAFASKTGKVFLDDVVYFDISYEKKYVCSFNKLVHVT